MGIQLRNTPGLRKCAALVCLLFPLIPALGYAAEPAGAVTLEQAFQAALTRTESFEIEVARVRRHEARVDIARGQLFPKVTLDAAHSRQDNTRGTVSSSSTRAKQSTVSVGLLQ